MIKKAVFVMVMFLMVGTVYAEEKKMPPAEQQKAPETQKEEFTPEKMQGLTQAMTPLFGEMMKVMMKAEMDVLAEPDTANKLATFTRNYYESLIKKGFSKEEAFEIAKAAGFPSFPMQK